MHTISVPDADQVTPATVGTAPADAPDVERWLATSARAPRWWPGLRSRARNTPLRPGHALRIYTDGAQAFNEMFAAMAAARESILVETYILDPEGPGRQLADLLTRKVDEGVAVQLIVDAVGSYFACGDYVEQLRERGVRVCVYNPIWPWQRGFRLAELNQRTHRKLIVLDSATAFIGGMNISSVYSSGSATGQVKTESPWRDTHARVTGPVVQELAAEFHAQWRQQTHAASGLKPEPAAFGRRSLPPPAPAPWDAAAAPTGAWIGAAASPPGSRRNPLYRALLDAIRRSQQEILVTTPYFVPTRRLKRELIAARQRGVRVALAVPAASDSALVHMMSRSHFGALLRAEIEIHEYQDAMLHAKTAVVDRIWFTLGSSNMDWRSLIHNAELNLIGIDPAVGNKLAEIFARDLRACRRVTQQQWQDRAWWSRWLEPLMRPLEFLL